MMSNLARFMLLAATSLLASTLLVSAAPIPKGAAEGNPFPAGSVWHGKLIQRGDDPTKFDCVFTITKRDAENFEATLYEHNNQFELTYLVRGNITLVKPTDPDRGFKVVFTSYEAKDVKNTNAILDVEYTAILSGKKLKGSWKPPEGSEHADMEGDFEFEQTKRKE